MQVAVYQILWCTKCLTWSIHAHRRCMRMKFREFCLQIDDDKGASAITQNGPGGHVPHPVMHGMDHLELPRSSFGCLTCSYVVRQCSIPYSVCGRGSSTCFNLYIMGSGRWPPEPVWVIPDVSYTCTLAIIDLQVNVKIIQVFTASVSVVAPGAPLRAS